jgi:superfamily II DNA or RNA helicase
MPLATRRPKTPANPASRPQRGATPAHTPSSAARRSFVLEVPFELRAVAQRAGAVWNPGAKAFVYHGERLPGALAPFRSEPYSWERLKEDELSGADSVPASPERDVQLRDHQKKAVAAVRAALDAGRTGFLNADDVGLGKTIETWAAALEMEDAETVLIVCPLAVVAHWRRTIQWMGDRGKRIVVINYDRLKKLFEVPAEIAPSAGPRRKRKTRKVRSAKGIARYGEAYSFDLIIWDESHKLRNVDAARSKLSLRLNAEAGFVMWLSATAGQNPLELAYLAPLLAERTGARASDLKDYERWCQVQGIGVVRGAYGKWHWRGDSKDPKQREAADDDLETMRSILFEGPVPAGIRRSPTDIAGWPEINRILLPVALDPQDRAMYGKLWDEFRNELGLEASGKSSSRNALVARLRFRQKASLLRTAATVDLATELLDQGLQVAISVCFKETMSVLQDALRHQGYAVAELHGDMTGPDKERQRMAFQQGKAPVCVYTVEEGISLHQGEYNDARRANLIHDLRWSAIQMKQIEGRTHRDGRFSQVYWMLGEDTVEEEIAEIVARRIRSMSRMQGDEGTVADIEKMLLSLAA